MRLRHAHRQSAIAQLRQALCLFFGFGRQHRAAAAVHARRQVIQLLLDAVRRVIGEREIVFLPAQPHDLARQRQTALAALRPDLGQGHVHAQLAALGLHEVELGLRVGREGVDGHHAGQAEDVLDVVHVLQEEFAEYLHKNDCTAVFECIDPIHDPHIVEYSHPHLVLLDLVYNDFNYSHAGYYTLIDVARHFGFYCKVLSKVIANWQEFKAFIDKWAARAYIEGFVFEDANGFMVKYKTPWYKNWKQARGVLQQVWTGRDIDAIKNIKTKLAFEPRLMDAIPEFVEECREQGRGTCPSVIELRNWFEN